MATVTVLINTTHRAMCTNFYLSYYDGGLAQYHRVRAERIVNDCISWAYSAHVTTAQEANDKLGDCRWSVELFRNSDCRQPERVAAEDLANSRQLTIRPSRHWLLPDDAACSEGVHSATAPVSDTFAECRSNLAADTLYKSSSMST